MSYWSGPMPLIVRLFNDWAFMRISVLGLERLCKTRSRIKEEVQHSGKEGIKDLMKHMSLEAFPRTTRPEQLWNERPWWGNRQSVGPCV